MKLIIFPGAADPYTVYKEVYDLLKEEAKRRNFTETILVNFPGHKSYDQNSCLSIPAAVKIIHSTIQKLENNGEEYIVVCRSYGCFPFIEYLKSYPKNIVLARKVILWGVSPYYQWYYDIFNDFNPTKFKAKDVTVTQELFKEIYPIELSINELSKDFPFKIYITSGDWDPHHPKHFQKLLKAINKNPKVILSNMIKGEEHAITKPNKEYFDLIFS